MKKILGLAAMALLIGGPAFGATTIQYTLELGGDNHADMYEANTPAPFTSGSTADGYAVPESKIVTWAVRAAASGDIGGVAIHGAANLVWTLEVRDANDQLVAALDAGSPSDTGWFSTINDGDADGARGGVVGPDELLNAAFAYAFETKPADPALGRIFDTPADSGPFMGRYVYPSTAGRPANSTAVGGTLVGMGAGYEEYRAELLGGDERGGVGLEGAEACKLGTGPVAEGQINLAGLPGGTYTLKLVPGKGNNVLRGDFFCDEGTPNNFAVAADQVQGDTITFVIIGPACDPAPALVSVASVKTHGDKGDHGVALDITGATTAVESRAGGLTKLVVKFNKAVGAADGTLDTEAAVSSGAVTGLTITGDTLTANVEGTTAVSCLTITLSGITCADGGDAIAPVALKLILNQGDVTGDGLVASADITQVKARSGLDVDATNFKWDVNADGIIASADITQVKSRSGNEVTCN